jgi:hypothetical protein
LAFPCTTRCTPIAGRSLNRTPLTSSSHWQFRRTDRRGTVADASLCCDRPALARPTNNPAAQGCSASSPARERPAVARSIGGNGENDSAGEPREPRAANGAASCQGIARRGITRVPSTGVPPIIGAGIVT